MIRCSRCVMPNTRPDTPFENGVCSACLSFEKRQAIDWTGRKRELELLLERGKNSSGFDCIVPSSGGKDSHWQVLTLLDLGAKPLVVTATTCHLTETGRKNIENLARYAATVQFTPKRDVRRKLNVSAMELVGDISWPEHVSIFTTPFRAAVDLGIPLVFYGENPQEAYGGPRGSDEARVMTRRWVSEFGGFLGLRVSDFEREGFDMTEYRPPTDEDLEVGGVEAHFLGAYYEWDSHRNALIARGSGFLARVPCQANLWDHENLDNAQTGLHDYAMFRKFGYGRGCAQASVDVRLGRMTRVEALQWVQEHDGAFPHVYAGVPVDEVLDALGKGRTWLEAQLDTYTNWALFPNGLPDQSKATL